MLKALGITKNFTLGGKNIEVLKSVQLTVEPKDKIAILGKSGAGKSTLLHILGTLEKPTSGSVSFLNQDLFKLEDERLSKFRNEILGFVFQFHYLMYEFTALENVMMPLLIAGEKKEEAKKNAYAILSRVGLKERVEHKPSQLSGGEQQRVAIARALVRKPRILFTDEMTGNLDSLTGQKVLALVNELHHEYGMSWVSVTHDEQLAKHFAKVFWLVDGVLHPH